MLDILCIAPHPDDAEIWCGGYLALATKQGYRVGVLDLSLGELSTRGDQKTRAKEIKEASNILKLEYRGNLKLGDGEIGTHPKHQDLLVKELRTLQPRLLIAPHWEERHPDHKRASQLVTSSAFFAALKNFKPSRSTLPHQVNQILYYPQRMEVEPSFFVDVTSVYPKKLQAMRAYSSQLSGGKGPKTLLSDPLTERAFEARDRYFGAKIGVEYAEGFISRSAIGLTDPFKALCTPERLAIQFFK